MAINPDTIPRYAPPTWAELADDAPARGACHNCKHATDVQLNGVWYVLCVCERDRHGEGDLMECGDDIYDCPEWEELT